MNEEFYLLQCGCVIKIVSHEFEKFGYSEAENIRCKNHTPFHNKEIQYDCDHSEDWTYNRGELITKTELAIIKLQRSNNE